MEKCECGSYAINHGLHGRDGSDGHLCDVCYWRKRAHPPSPGAPDLEAAEGILWDLQSELHHLEQGDEEAAADAVRKAAEKVLALSSLPVTPSLSNRVTDNGQGLIVLKGEDPGVVASVNAHPVTPVRELREAVAKEIYRFACEEWANWEGSTEQALYFTEADRILSLLGGSKGDEAETRIEELQGVVQYWAEVANYLQSEVNAARKAGFAIGGSRKGEGDLGPLPKTEGEAKTPPVEILDALLADGVIGNWEVSRFQGGLYVLEVSYTKASRDYPQGRSMIIHVENADFAEAVNGTVRRLSGNSAKARSSEPRSATNE